MCPKRAPERRAIRTNSVHCHWDQYCVTVSFMAPPVKRSREYRSVVRAEQAQRTRERIVEAARSRFLEHGYAGTSVASIAEEATVAPETVYDVFGTKRRVLEAVIEVRVAGGSDEPADYLERSWVKDILAIWRTSPPASGVRSAHRGHVVAGGLYRRGAPGRCWF